ncbi:uncharacterized protein L201_006477 [Kwoniella dendrophila CBS 6074]|uniref:Enoyl reductase (ER) domain-containing protein n=1 Tax=Kwoniella dendrophila CBS 6074 TaxID=1295534 RepID=A0AAX4K1C4_9TREE
MSSLSSIPDTVRAVVASPDLGNPTVENLPFGTRQDIQNLGPYSVVVKNKAVGLNPTDYKHAHGDWSSKKPVVIGSDGAGEALAVGSKVNHIKQGDRVAGMVYGASSEIQGSASEGLVYDAANTWVMPAGMSDLEGASFTLPHLTAVQALYMRWKLAKPSSPDTSSPKKTILIWGGSTSVGHHAVQLANLSGYRVFVTASSSNHSRLIELGASECFDYKDSDVLDKIKKAAGSQGIFAAYDTASSNGSTEICIDAIGPNGGNVISTLPPSDEIANRRKDVKVEFFLVYTTVGYAFKFANAFDFNAIPEDREQSYEWMTKELPLLLEGWKEGSGSPKYKPQALRVEKGLERVQDGLRILEKGNYKAEKLVYSI